MEPLPGSGPGGRVCVAVRGLQDFGISFGTSTGVLGSEMGFEGSGQEE